MNDDQRRPVAFHETGHTAMLWWSGYSLRDLRIVLHEDRFGGQTHFRKYYVSEEDLMVLIGGPMAEFLCLGIVPEGVLRFKREYRDSNSDSVRMRKLVRQLCNGTDSRKYQLAVQQRCLAVMRDLRMWKAINVIAETLMTNSEITGTACEKIFKDFSAPDRTEIATKSVWFQKVGPA